MPRDWNDRIMICELADEPELSEEFAAIFEHLGTAAPGGEGGGAGAQKGGGQHLVLNFAGVTYLNSSHLAALLRVRKRMLELGKSLVLCSLGDDVWSVMMLTGLDKVFRFANDPMTALAGLQIEDEGDPR